ncbi:MAG: hypothetical protein HRU12_23955 [Phaeodactylibacter sp.]|nr:hypothetical protein [Phaeodactylibacter sp.]
MDGLEMIEGDIPVEVYLEMRSLDFRIPCLSQGGCISEITSQGKPQVS